jgi:hypothetical protein
MNKTLRTEESTRGREETTLGPKQMTLFGSHEPLGPQTSLLSRSARALGGLAAWLFCIVGARSPTDTSTSMQHDARALASLARPSPCWHGLVVSTRFSPEA